MARIIDIKVPTRSICKYRSEEHTSELQSQFHIVCRLLLEKKKFKKVISRRNIRRRITIPLTLSNLKLLRRITRTENILHRNFTRRQVAIQNRVASNIGISQSTFIFILMNLLPPSSTLFPYTTLFR